jgi:hypothetical protein
MQRRLDRGTCKNDNQQRDEQHACSAATIDSAVAAARTGILRRHEISVVMKWACH